MTIRDDIYFVYNGITSLDMGVMSVNLDKGMLEETFMPSTKINEITIRGRSRPYFMGIDRDPIRISLVLAFKDSFTSEQIEETARWLSQPYYRELYFSNDPHRRYYVIYEGDTKLIHNGISRGYLELEMRNIDCFRYSPVYQSPIYDFSSNPSGKDLTFYNEGSEPSYPTLYLEKIGAGTIQIVNYSNQGKELIITDLADGEKLTIDMEDRSIETNLSGILRYNNHNNVFVEMVQGNNYLKIYGNCRFKWEYQFKYLS